MGDEIERKFLPAELPEGLKKCEHEEILQGYLVTSENASVRVRSKGDKYFLTFKSGKGRKRQELEPELLRDQFDELWPGTEGKRVAKTRHYFPAPRTVEVNVYHGKLEGLTLFEVEFSSDEDSEKFVPPSWFGREVTDDPRFLDMNLAEHGIERLLLPKFQYDLEDGLARLIQAVEERLPCQEKVVVNVAGGTSSGKTTAVAAKLKEHFGRDAILISMDDYYRGNTYINMQRVQGKEINWDMPDALNLELLAEHLQMLKMGKPVQKPVYNFKTGEPYGIEDMQPAKVIIAEGLFALNERVVSEADVRVYVDISTHGMLLRRLLRDIHRTNLKPAEILKYFATTVLPMHEQYVNSTKIQADLVISNEYRPEIEAQRAGMYEVQVKVRAYLHPEDLRKLGAESLGCVLQTDHYFSPQDRVTDESIRIRSESGRLILGYKGPKIDSDVRKRPKFEFEIDDETERYVRSMYDMTKTIAKKRTLYQLDGAVFSVDDTSRLEDGAMKSLGSFVEVRSTGGEEKIYAVLEKLSLDKMEKITKPYIEM